MNQLEEINNLFKLEIKKLEQGVLTSLFSIKEIVLSDSIGYRNKTLVAAKIYEDKNAYSIVYLMIDKNGNLVAYKENEGILPILYLNPNKECFVSINIYHPDKDLSIEIPLFDRTDFVQAKASKSLVGDFIDIYKQYSVFYDVDIWSDKKPDKIIFLEFKDRQLKKRHVKKVVFPKNNKICIDTVSDEIHLLAKNENNLLHRIIDEKADVIKSREIVIKEDKVFVREILNLLFDQDSYILCELESKHFILLVLKPDGSYSLKPLIDIGTVIFNTWKPTKIDVDTYVVQFNTQFGNGWITIQKDSLLEAFYSNDNTGMYRDLLYGNNIDLSKGSLILSKINKTSDNAYSVLFYTRTEGKTENKSAFVLNRQIS